MRSHRAEPLVRVSIIAGHCAPGAWAHRLLILALVATSRSSRHARIEVRLPANASPRQTRELGAFARYCVQRIEKDLGERQRWLVEIALGSRGYAALVEVEHQGLVLEARGRSQDAPLAVWDAICRIEQDLRDRRGAVFATRPAKPAND